MATSVTTSFADSTYSASNKPSVTTLKADVQAIETAINAHNVATTGEHGVTGTFVGSSDAQTLSNKTLTKPIINASTLGVQSYTPGIGGTATLDLSLANRNTITMPAGAATIALSNATTGQVFTVEITQDGVGSRTVTWFTTIRWTDGTAPTLTTTASKRDVFGFICTGSNTYDGYTIGMNI